MRTLRAVVTLVAAPAAVGAPTTPAVQADSGREGGDRLPARVAAPR